jgi:hypothetical protein
MVRLACSDAVDAVYTAPAGLPAFDPSHRGDVVRCAYDRTLTHDQINTAATNEGYTGPPLMSGARVYRIAYRTTRAPTAAGATPDGLSAALVFVPDTPRAGPQPLVVVGHASIGIAERCAPSRNELLTRGDWLDDFRSLLLPLVGYGWTVVATDYAGFGYGSTPGWSLAADEAHSLLDSTRAMTNLLAPGSLSGDVVMVGHSQGGHAVLAAHALARSYGLSGRLVGTAAFAPLWFSSRAWGAILTSFAGYTTADNAGPIAYAMEYFYGHGELIDGPGHGLDPFRAALRTRVQTLETTSCLLDVAAETQALGATPADIFDPTFVSAVGPCGAFGSCTSPLATTWQQRFLDDRPPIDPAGPPILIWEGLADTTVTPGLLQCALDKIQNDLVSSPGMPSTVVTVCADPIAIHGAAYAPGTDLTVGITRRDIDHVNRWIAARTMGGPEPTGCSPWPDALPDGGAITCPNPPPND